MHKGTCKNCCLLYTSDFPFDVGEVENIEMYHYTGVPVSAEKKVVVAETDITDLYDKFEDLSLMEKQVEETTGAVSYTHLS